MQDQNLIAMRALFSTRIVVACLFSFAVSVSVVAQYSLTVEASPAVHQGLARYRFYVECNNAGDGLVTTIDLLEFLAAFGIPCE